MQTNEPSALLNAARRSTVLLALVLLACATQKQPDVVNAATTPLSDLNVVHAEIPAVLVDAQKEPYAIPTGDQSCASLDASVVALDEVLGPDLDAPASASNPGLIERGSAAAGTAAVGALRRTAEGVVPFRAWVRKVSGAERYSKQVAAAIAAGTVRRAFLKGLRVSKECP